MNKNILFIGFIIFLVGCSQANTSQNNDAGSSNPSADALWINTELKDVRTGESFKISDFKGQKVLFESFAVWCPTCTQQQRITKELEEQGTDVISISLDTDPNEDEDQVLEHINDNGFDWRYAIAPTEMTQDLIDEFGLGIVNAPRVPMVLICEDGSRRMLKGGLKRVDTLKDEIAKGCNG